MIDEELKESVNRKIEDGSFGPVDIPDYLTVFCQLGNDLEELQEEVDGWNRQIAFELAGAGNYWVAVNDGRFTTGKGTLKDQDLLLTIDAIDAARLFSGDLDAEAALNSGALRIFGDLPDAIKVQELFEIAGEEIEY
jgi:hypothetical protein